MSTQKSEIAILILSCDKFKATWQPCIDHLFSSWSDCSHKVYLLNNFTSCNDSRVVDLLIGEDVSWSDSLKKGLAKINEDRVFFIYDDTFILDISLEKVEHYFQVAFNENLQSLAFRKNPFDKGTFYKRGVNKLDKKTKYRTSLFLNLFQKSLLLEILKDGESAWQFEKIGTQRSMFYDFFTVNDSMCFKFHHGIIKGKWLPNVKRYLKKEGYFFNDSEIGEYSRFQVFIMRVYSIFFILINRLLQFFNQIEFKGIFKRYG